MVPLWLWAVFAFLLGSCVGSFLNVVIWRLPRGGSIVRPSSSCCPHCHKPIAWYDNIPIVSWLLLRARCRQCGGPISIRYPLVELAAAVLFAGLLLGVYGGPLRGDLGEWPANWPGYLAAVVLLAGLLAGSVIDMGHFFIPLPAVWVGGLAAVVLSAAFPGRGLPIASAGTAAWGIGGAVGLSVAAGLLRLGVLPVSFAEEVEADADGEAEGDKPADLEGDDERDRPAPPSIGVTVGARREVCKELLFLAPVLVGGLAGWWLTRSGGPLGAAWQRWCGSEHLRGLGGSLFGLLIGGGIIWTVRIIGTLIAGREAMGLGDVHLLASAGALIGWSGAALAFFISPFFGLAVGLVQLARHGRRELPFGPYLSLGVLVVLLFYDRLVEWLGPSLAVLFVPSG